MHDQPQQSTMSSEIGKTQMLNHEGQQPFSNGPLPGIPQESHTYGGGGLNGRGGGRDGVGGMARRGPQSPQSVPISHLLELASGPPSSQ